MWFNLFIYPTGIDRMLVMSQAFQELEPTCEVHLAGEERNCKYLWPGAPVPWDPYNAQYNTLKEG